VVPERYLVQTPDKANATVRAQLALPLSDRHPDYPALLVANQIFGQGGNSRLWQRIRQREGLSYGVGSGVSWNPIDDNSTWSLGASFAPQNLDRLEGALKEELARSLAEGFSAGEVEQARTGLLNARRLSRAQDAGVAGQLAANLYLERRFAVSQQVDEAIAALTPEQVNAAWRRHIDPQRIVYAWGGDFKP
jgi:zinc protease